MNKSLSASPLGLCPYRYNLGGRGYPADQVISRTGPMGRTTKSASAVLCCPPCHPPHHHHRRCRHCHCRTAQSRAGGSRRRRRGRAVAVATTSRGVRPLSSLQPLSVNCEGPQFTLQLGLLLQTGRVETGKTWLWHVGCTNIAMVGTKIAHKC